VAELETVLGGLNSPEEPELGFPIKWNTMEVQGNFAFSLGDEPENKFIKVSEHTLTLDELSRVTICEMVDGQIAYQYLYDGGQDGGSMVVACYHWENGGGSDDLTCISVFATTDLGNGIILEPGFYARDYGVMGTNSDFVLDMIDTGE
jgi:hypothetical protein